MFGTRCTIYIISKMNKRYKLTKFKTFFKNVLTYVIQFCILDLSVKSERNMNMLNKLTKESKTLREWMKELNLVWMENPEDDERGWLVYNGKILITVFNQGGYALSFVDLVLEMNTDHKYFMPNLDIMDFDLKYSLADN